MSTLLDVGEQEHLDGVLATLRELGAVVYERDDLPDALPPAYSEIEVTRASNGNSRSGGPAAVFGAFTITERSAAMNAAALRVHRDSVASIEGQVIEIAGRESTPVAFNPPADPIAPEDGWYVGFRTWTYALF